MPVEQQRATITTENSQCHTEGWKHGTGEFEVNSAKDLMGQKKALKGNPKDEIWRTSYVLTNGGEK